MSVLFNFSAAVFGGLVSNIGLMKLNNLHKGCANVCTLFQFMFGLSQTLLSPSKRAVIFSSSSRRLPLKMHMVFALMFFIGPWCGNYSVAITKTDFYPVFLVVRSCGSVTSMIIGYLFAGKIYSTRQVLGVILITIGAAVTTLGCYNGSQQFKASQSIETSEESVTSDRMFIAGLGLLLICLLNDSCSGVLQSTVFASFLAKDRLGNFKVSVVDESMAMMSFVGTLLMSLVAGKEVFYFISTWVANPTWYHMSDFSSFGLDKIFGVLTVSVPLEFVYLTVNFVGNWNAKLLCTWLNGHASVVLSALVPMFYRLMSTMISTQFAGVELPLYTWFGICLVFVGSLLYILSPNSKPSSSPQRNVETDDNEKKGA